MRDRGGDVLEGKYRLVQRIGAGGMGSVYVAEHVQIGKRVAVKLLHREHAHNQEALRRFHQEARAAAAAGHRGIVDVHDIGVTDEGEPYIVMELLEGESLGALLARERTLSVPMAIEIALAALSALAAAHRRGIVHRDIKPDNVFLERTMADLPQVKLLDFGVSKVTNLGDPSTTLSGIALGTPRYMAPEQARGDADLDARIDLYAMGVILYEALTGAVPFDAPTANAVLVRILTEPPRPPRELRPELPAPLEALILKAMAKEPAQRFRRAEDMIEALLELTGSESDSRARLQALVPPSRDEDAGVLVATQTPQSWSTGVTTPPPRSQGRAVLAVGALVFLVGGALGIAWLGRAGAPPPVVEAKWIAPPPAAAPAVAPAAAVEAAPVAITLEGLPAGARVTLDDAVVPEPGVIRLAARSVMLRLHVEADGYAPFNQMVMPDRDRVVAVAMTPDVPVAASHAGPPRRRAPGRASRPAAPTPPSSPALPPIVDPGPGLPPIVNPGPGLPPIVPAGPPRHR